jgi:putative nucleotidyltransferase with HDIG domain
MYVAELDRPWLESPFLFQGFLIESADQLKLLKQCCAYVFIDEAQGVARPESPRPAITSAGARQVDGREAPVLRTRLPDRGREDFQSYISRAKTDREVTERYVSRMLEDARLGHGVDVTGARRIVHEMVTSVSETPYAALWLTNLKNKHEYTMVHSVNVCVLALAFGLYLKLPREDLEVIGLGALLHDVGKMRTPIEILDKPGPLTEEEFDVMQKHPLDGYSIVRKQSGVPPGTLEIIRFHHERLSGNGYPDGLLGEDIGMWVRLVAIADVYDAITSDKIYRDGIPAQEGLSMMYHMAPNEFGKELMQKFIKCIGIYPIGSLVELNTGDVGVVMSTNRRNRLKPVVMLLKTAKGANYPRRPLLNLAAPPARAGEPRWTIKRVVDMKDYGIDLNRIVARETYK